MVFAVFVIRCVEKKGGHSYPSPVGQECPTYKTEGGVSYIDCNVRDADDQS